MYKPSGGILIRRWREEIGDQFVTVTRDTLQDKVLNVQWLPSEKQLGHTSFSSSCHLEV
jgi:hypothetical protein